MAAGLIDGLKEPSPASALRAFCLPSPPAWAPPCAFDESRLVRPGRCRRSATPSRSQWHACTHPPRSARLPRSSGTSSGSAAAGPKGTCRRGRGAPGLYAASSAELKGRPCLSRPVRRPRCLLPRPPPSLRAALPAPLSLKASTTHPNPHQVFFSLKNPLLRWRLPFVSKLLYTNGTWSYFTTVRLPGWNWRSPDLCCCQMTAVCGGRGRASHAQQQRGTRPSLPARSRATAKPAQVPAAHPAKGGPPSRQLPNVALPPAPPPKLNPQVLTSWTFQLVPFVSLMFDLQPVKFGREFAIAATCYLAANFLGARGRDLGLRRRRRARARAQGAHRPPARGCGRAKRRARSPPFTELTRPFPAPDANPLLLGRLLILIH